MHSSTFPVAKYSCADNVVEGMPQWQHKHDQNMYLIVDSSPPGLDTSQWTRGNRYLKVMHNANCLDLVHIEELARNTQLAVRDAKARGIDLVALQYPVSAIIKYPNIALRYRMGDGMHVRRIQVKLMSERDYDFAISFLKDVQCPISHANETQRPGTAVGTSNVNNVSSALTSNPFVSRFANPANASVSHKHVTESQTTMRSQQPTSQPLSNTQMTQQTPAYTHLPLPSHTTPVSSQYNNFHASQQKPPYGYQQYSTVASLEQNIGFSSFANDDENLLALEPGQIQPTNFKRPISRPSTASQIYEAEAQRHELFGAGGNSSRADSKNSRPGTSGGARSLSRSEFQGNDTAAGVEEQRHGKKAPTKSAKGTTTRRPLSSKDTNTASPPGSSVGNGRPSAATTAATAASTKGKAAAGRSKAAVPVVQERTEDGPNTDPAVMYMSSSAHPAASIVARNTATHGMGLCDDVATDINADNTRVMNVFAERQRLAAYAAESSHDRQKTLDAMIQETLDDPSFPTLCQDIYEAWRRAALPWPF